MSAVLELLWTDSRIHLIIFAWILIAATLFVLNTETKK